MDSRTPLLTLVHLSDLHFGVPSAEDGVQPPDWWRRCRRFDGLLGHHRDALIHLTTFMHDIRRTDETVHVVVTGDLTAVGKAEEFDLATKFIQSSIETDFGPVGLAAVNPAALCIPGNHDHWPGRRTVMGHPVALDRTFPVRPMTPVSLPLPNNRKLVLLGVNSDEDVNPLLWDRWVGRGAFVSQLQSLERQVGPPADNEIRVLMVHHSPAYRDHILGISTSSRLLLDEMVARTGISVLLTGHIHTALGHVVQVSDSGTTWDLLEARCGTTTQLDRLPSGWIAAGTNAADRLAKNSLIVHRLYDNDSRIEWECELYVRLHFGFQPKGNLPGLKDKSIVVWPR